MDDMLVLGVIASSDSVPVSVSSSSDATLGFVLVDFISASRDIEGIFPRLLGGARFSFALFCLRPSLALAQAHSKDFMSLDGE